MKTILMRGAMASLALAALLAHTPVANATVLYLEGADLSGDINSPSDLSVVVSGNNTVQGGVSATWQSTGPFSGVWTGDTLDAFSFDVPAGLRVDLIEVAISNFSQTVSSVFGEVVSTATGLEGPFPNGDPSLFFAVETTIENILSDVAPIEAGTHTVGVQIADTCPGCIAGGTLSFDYQVTIRTIPEPAAVAHLAGAAFVGLARRRRRRIV